MSLICGNDLICRVDLVTFVSTSLSENLNNVKICDWILGPKAVDLLQAILNFELSLSIAGNLGNSLSVVNQVKTIDSLEVEIWAGLIEIFLHFSTKILPMPISHGLISEVNHEWQCFLHILDQLNDMLTNLPFSVLFGELIQSVQDITGTIFHLDDVKLIEVDLAPDIPLGIPLLFDGPDLVE